MEGVAGIQVRVTPTATNDLTLAKKAAFKVGISTSTVAIGGIFNLPSAELHVGNPAYDILSKAYTITMFMSLSIGLMLLLLSVVLPQASNSVSMAKKLMRVALVLVQIALALGTYMMLMVA